MDRGTPENFVGHPVADAGKAFLHKEHGLHRRAGAAFQKSLEVLFLEGGGEEIGRELGPPLGRVGAFVEEDAAEHARVLEDQRVPGLAQDEVVVFQGLIVGLFDA